MIADMSLCNGLQTNAEVIHMYPHDCYRQQRPQPRLNNSWKLAYIEPPYILDLR